MFAQLQVFSPAEQDVAADKEGGYWDNIRRAEKYKTGFQSHAEQGWRFRKKNLTTGKFIYQDWIWVSGNGSRKWWSEKVSRRYKDETSDCRS